MMIAMVVCVTLSACASAPQGPVTTLPVQPQSAAITPVELGGLEGSDALLFPDVDVPTAIAGVEGYAARCLAPQGFQRVGEPHGFSLFGGDPEPYLRVTVASVSESSALGLGGSGLTPDLKEAIAATVQGRPRCAP